MKACEGVNVQIHVFMNTYFTNGPNCWPLHRNIWWSIVREAYSLIKACQVSAKDLLRLAAPTKNPFLWGAQ
jgi:hypothetical protein